MCNPAAVGVISNVMTQVVEIGNQQIQAKENYRQAKYNSEIALANAKEARNNAKLEQQEGRIKILDGQDFHLLIHNGSRQMVEDRLENKGFCASLIDQRNTISFSQNARVQFAFFDDDSEYLPRTYTTPNCVAYPGSHDADCVRSWCRELQGEARARFNKECPHRKGQSRAYDLIELAMSSCANLAVVPIQDYLELTNEQGRMNTPSVAQGNWNYRLSPRYRTETLTKKITDLTVRTRRATK